MDQILDTLCEYPEGSRVMILAPVIRGKKGEHRKVLEDAVKAGFLRAVIDGETVSLEDEVTLDKKRKHSVSIVVDRIVMKKDIRKRLSESIETALEVAEGQVLALRKEDGRDYEEFFSQKNSCSVCGISIPELQPRLFSFNNPYGACETCSGLGITMEFDPELVIPDRSLSFDEGGIATHNPAASWHRSWFESLAHHYKFSLATTFRGPAR